MAGCSKHVKPLPEMGDRQCWSGASAVRRVSTKTPTLGAIASLYPPLYGVHWRDMAESISATLWSSLARYGGAIEFRQRYVSSANLKSIRCGIRSQCRSRSSGLMSSCFRAEKTIYCNAVFLLLVWMLY